jgi:hypothetical protein
MGEGPMSATTLSVQGLSPDDAVEIVRRKIQRALRANATCFKVLFLPDSAKTQRKIEGYLETVESVRKFFIDADHPGTLWIHF